MKKQLLALLCLLPISLCSCEKAKPIDKSTATTTKKVAATTTQKVAVKSDMTTTKVATGESVLTTEALVTYASYDEFLKETCDRLDVEGSYLVTRYYTFYDIDGDGVQEMLIGGETRYGIVIFSVYTMQNGVAVYQKDLSIWMSEFDRERWLLTNGTIKTAGFDEYGSGYGYYRVEDGELKRMAGIMIEGGEYMRSYTEGGYRKVAITKEEFEKVQKEMEGDGQVVQLNWLSLEDYKP